MNFIKKVCENKDICDDVNFSKKTKILEFNQYRKSDKVRLIIYAGLECLIKKFDGCKNKPENSSTTKAGELFHQVFHCQQYHHLEAFKITMIYTEVNNI